nr:NSP1 [Rotavirus I]
MSFINLIHYCSSAGGARHVLSKKAWMHGEVIRKTVSDKRLSDNECRIDSPKTMYEPNMRVILADLCFCKASCDQMHLLAGTEFVARPQLCDSRVILLPCGVEDAEIDHFSRNVMVEGLEFEMCTCGNRRIKRADVFGLELANIYTICQNNLNTVIYNEGMHECIHCTEPTFDIEPANGFGGNGYTIEHNRCLNCTTWRDIVKILEEDGFHREWEVAPRNPFNVNNCMMATLITCASTWEKDLTADGDIESNPGPFQAFSEMYLKCLGKRLAFEESDYNLKLYQLVLKYWPRDEFGPQHNCAIFRLYNKYFMAYKFRSRWFASKSSMHSVVPMTANLCYSSYIRDLTRENVEPNPGPDPISEVNQHAQKTQNHFPIYEFEKVIVDQEFKFKCTCFYLDKKTESHAHFSKKNAKMDAAEKMLRLIY